MPIKISHSTGASSVEIGEAIELASANPIVAFPDGTEYLKSGVLYYRDPSDLDAYKKAFDHSSYEMFRLGDTLLSDNSASAFYYGIAAHNDVIIASRASANGAHYISRDGGATWTFNASIVNGTTSMGYIYHFKDGIFIVSSGGTQNYLWYSLDYGTTWTRLTGITSASTPIVTNGSRAVYGYGGGIAYSDNGVNWTSRTVQPDGYSCYSVSYFNGHFYAYYLGGQLYKSVDAVTWTLVIATTAYGNNKFVQIGDWYLRYGNYFETRDGGATWTRPAPAFTLPDMTTNINYSFDFSVDNAVLGADKFSLDGKYVYQSIITKLYGATTDKITGKSYCLIRADNNTTTTVHTITKERVIGLQQAEGSNNTNLYVRIK